MKLEKSPFQLHTLPVSFKWGNKFKTKFFDDLSSQQVVDRLNKFSNACLKDDSYDVDDAVKDLSDVVFVVAEATLPVYRFTCIENSKHSQEMKNKCFDKSCFELNKQVLRFGKLIRNFPLIPLCEVHFL